MRQIVASILAAFAMSGCSSSDAPSGPKCSPATCAAGAFCIGDSCQRGCTRQTDCPSGSYCNDDQPRSWCASNTLPMPPAPMAGQFLKPCRSPTECDGEKGFACYGTGTTDAAAFCTLFDCALDSDCPGGWWCARVNKAPNVASDARTFGETLNWCLPRDYCAPCKTDHDCQSSVPRTETEKHCVQGANGGGFCSPQCASNTNCPPDAQCATRWTVCGPRTCKTTVDCPSLGGVPETCVAGECRLPCTGDADCPPSNLAPQHCSSGVCVTASCASDDDCPPTAGTFQHCNAGACTPECAAAADCAPDQACQSLSVCSPLAGVCVGDGSFCSPCQSDDDCTCASDAACAKGYCVDAAPYSTERFCSQPIAGGAICSANGPPPGACPAPPRGASARGIACSAVPGPGIASQCLGTVFFGKSAGSPQQVPGCWTPNR